MPFFPSGPRGPIPGAVEKQQMNNQRIEKQKSVNCPITFIFIQSTVLPPIAPFSPGGPGIPSCPWFPLGPDGPGAPGAPLLPK